MLSVVEVLVDVGTNAYSVVRGRLFPIDLVISARPKEKPSVSNTDNIIDHYANLFEA